MTSVRSNRLIRVSVTLPVLGTVLKYAAVPTRKCQVFGREQVLIYDSMSLYQMNYSTESIGCYMNAGRTLSNSHLTSMDDNSPDSCAARCRFSRNRYFALEFGMWVK
jgi:hypothetical protein